MKSVQLEEVCEIIMGQAPPGSSYNSQGTGMALLAGAGDFGELFPDPQKFTTAPQKISKAGDIILCIRATIGDLNWADRDYCLGRGVAGLRVHGDFDAKFLWRWLEANKFSLAKLGKGSTFKQVTRADIGSLSIPLFSISEQRRIAAILDKADAIRRKRQEASQLAKDFLKSAFLELFGNPLTNSKHWKLNTLSSIADVHRGRFSPRPRNDPRYYGGPYPFIQTGEIAKAGGYLRDWRQSLNEEGIKVSRLFPKGTVVIAIVGATIGETAILGFDSYAPDSVVGIEPCGSRSTGEYIEFLLRFWRSVFLAKAPETARANINLETIRPLEVPVPPVELQVKFSKIYHVTFDLCQKLELHSTELFESLSQRAFRGEL